MSNVTEMQMKKKQKIIKKKKVKNQWVFAIGNSVIVKSKVITKIQQISKESFY